MSNHSSVPASRAAIYRVHGDAASVLAWEPDRVAAPGPGEALVELEAAVVHPSDFGIIAGTYGRTRPAPAVGGREGVGRVVAVGPGAGAPAIGSRVRMPPDAGVWRERGVFAFQELEAVPADLSPEQAAQCFVNPTAAIRMLETVPLNPGDVVVQNAGNSAVGKVVAFLGKRRGLRVVSLVRDVARHEAELLALGAEAIFADDDEAPKRIRALKGASPVRLALNSIGGASVSRLIKSCDAGATVVTFGGMTGEPVRFPTRELIFSDIVLRGFWIDRWLREASREETARLFSEVYALWRAGFPTGVEKTYPVSDIVEAVKHAARPGRSGKILVRGPAWK